MLSTISLVVALMSPPLVTNDCELFFHMGFPQSGPSNQFQVGDHSGMGSGTAWLLIWGTTDDCCQDLGRVGLALTGAPDVTPVGGSWQIAIDYYITCPGQNEIVLTKEFPEQQGYVGYKVFALAIPQEFTCQCTIQMYWKFRTKTQGNPTWSDWSPVEENGTQTDVSFTAICSEDPARS
jgi:hypothetical protein